MPYSAIHRWFTLLLFLPVLNLLLRLELFCVSSSNNNNGILSLYISAHLTVLPLVNLVLNLTFFLLPITSSHSHASALDLTLDYWRYLNI